MNQGSKGCLNLLAAIAAAAVLVTLLLSFIVWYNNGPGNPYDVALLKGDIQQHLPVGSSKAQVRAWLQAKHFDIYPECFDARHKNKWGDYLNYGSPHYKHIEHDLLGRVNATRSAFPCSYDVIACFAFNQQSKLIRSGVYELSTCL